MQVRKNVVLFPLAAALAAAGCGRTPRLAEFQMAFLPLAPRAAVVADDPEPPPVPAPNVYLNELPALLNVDPQVSDRKTRADALIQQAERRFQRGKRYYQSKDIPNARRDFDAAVDLTLEASAVDPDDRSAYQASLDSMVDAIHRFDLLDMGAAATPDQDKFDKAPLEDILQMTFPVDPKLKDRVREQVSATSSQLPLSVNDAVLGYIQYFSNRGRKSLINGLERSGRYAPMIQRILDEEGLPQELIRLAQAESGFIPRAISRKAAGGMWQFLASRGQQYGLSRTVYADERMDPEKATHAAARHLRDLYQEFGDWYLAMAAYDCGPVTVEKAVERTGYADFWELRRLGVLPVETTNYVPIILAMTIMEKNASEYGLDSVQFDPPLEYDTVDVQAPTSLALISDITGAPLAELASLNPALLKGIAPADYALHVPKGSGSQLMAAIQLVPSEHRNAWRIHEVEPGETLASIARRYGIAASGILAANHLRSAETAEGDRLLIPLAPRPEAPVRRAAARAPAGKKPPVRAAARKAVAASSKSSVSAKPAPPVVVARAAAR
jgi:membrane-bound lytic murein transglycosylase D